MNWKPLADRIIVRKTDADNDTTTSGIVMVGVDPNEKTLEAEVVAVGSGQWVGSNRVPIAVSVGDVIMYDKQYGQDMPHDPSTKAEYLMLHEEDILAVIG